MGDCAGGVGELVLLLDDFRGLAGIASLSEQGFQPILKMAPSGQARGSEMAPLTKRNVSVLP